MKQTAYNEQPTPGTPPGMKTTDENTKGATERNGVGGIVVNSFLLTGSLMQEYTLITYIKSTQSKFSSIK
jgi:hypothetical protein